MKYLPITLLIVTYLLILGVLSYNVSYAFFTSSATSTNNSFTAAEEFPQESEETIPQNIADHIVISEIQIATSGASTSDFIELYNPTQNSISLNGMRLVKRTNGGTLDTQIIAFDSGDSIPAHGFFLWASNDGNYNDHVSADASTGENIAGNNSIALRNGPVDTGTIIDAVGWGTPSGTPLFESSLISTGPPDNQSLERKALSTSDATSMTSGVDVNKGNGFDSDNNSSDFILRTTSQPQNSTSSIESL